MLKNFDVFNIIHVIFLFQCCEQMFCEFGISVLLQWEIWDNLLHSCSFYFLYAYLETGAVSGNVKHSTKHGTPEIGIRLKLFK